MRILFNLLTTIEVQDAEVFPTREQFEEAIVELFESEGMIAHGLEITNYCVPAEEQEGE